ncbi:MAG: permease [Burkholderiaceae bacterium]
MQRVLSFEQTPPLNVPLRFFLSAPLFALAASLVLLWHGGAALDSRWNPQVLAMTHLLTLGFLGLCMIGSVLQILPVIAGVEVPRSVLTASAVHGLLSSGTAFLAAGFLRMESWLFGIALLLLGVAFLVFLGACLLGLIGVESDNSTLKAVRLALLALGVTVILGVLLASVFVIPLPLPVPMLTDLHAAWGLAGWVGLLVVAVAFQVVPMFQVTEIYPAAVTRWLAISVLVLLALLSAGMATFTQKLHLTDMAPIIIALLYAVFGLVTWRLIRRRKRPKAEPTTFFWYTALGCLIAASLSFILAQAYPALHGNTAYPLFLGMLFLVGFGYSVVNGMLYKIVPFLVWYHLQDRLFDAGMKAPNVRQVISENATRRQFFTHVLGLALLQGAVIWPSYLTRPAALCFFASSFLLWMNLLGAAKVYRNCLAEADARSQKAGTV